MTATTSNSCSNRLLVRDASNPSGIIQSTYLGSSYRNNVNCSWNLSSNAVLELVFVSFKTELSGDYVYVYDGDSPSAPLIGQFSGSSLPATITSSSNKLYVRFISDSSGQDAGFRALYRGMLLLRIIIRLQRNPQMYKQPHTPPHPPPCDGIKHFSAIC